MHKNKEILNPFSQTKKKMLKKIMINQTKKNVERKSNTRATRKQRLISS
ncbi:hypothetical protein ES332_D11G271000v1 [Gossypium tomentosum]|uniref:Uncharacterized protein n=1 Tax=Gossypium tomentosum TaxID=34277 RepID=A0A5D2ITY9_GOSTO|nr:hypothetical protein ES332_D11G271000v1 [Gossypium tomentosum]